jgi:hypothetical protein
VPLVVVAVPLAATGADCRHHSEVSEFSPPREAPMVTEDWDLLPPGETCSYRWGDGAVITYNKTLPWLRTLTIP